MLNFLTVGTFKEHVFGQSVRVVVVVVATVTAATSVMLYSII